MLKFLKVLRLASKYNDLLEVLVGQLTKVLDNEPNPGKITKEEISQILLSLLPNVIEVLGKDKVID